MRNTFWIALVMVALSCHVQVFSATKDLVLWPLGDFPPYSIASGPSKWQGAGDQRTKILINHLPEYEHQIIEAPLSRLVEMLKSKPNVCTITLLKTPERERYLEFSSVSLLGILPNGFITTRKRLALLKPYINRQGELNLRDFLASGKYRVGIPPDRSFGNNIDAILELHRTDGALVFLPSIDQLSSRLLKLFYHNEFEGAIGYPIELHYVVRELGLPEDDFMIFPIEGEPLLIPTFAACSKSAFGKRVIEQINRLGADPGTHDEMNAAYRHFLDPDTAKYFDQILAQSKTHKP